MRQPPGRKRAESIEEAAGNAPARPPPRSLARDPEPSAGLRGARGAALLLLVRPGLLALRVAARGCARGLAARGPRLARVAELHLRQRVARRLSGDVAAALDQRQQRHHRVHSVARLAEVA